jgi:hypothetical protein
VSLFAIDQLHGHLLSANRRQGQHGAEQSDVEHIESEIIFLGESRDGSFGVVAYRHANHEPGFRQPIFTIRDDVAIEVKSSKKINRSKMTLTPNYFICKMDMTPSYFSV